MQKCQIKGCDEDAIARSGNAGGLLVCQHHFLIFGASPDAQLKGPKMTGPECLQAGHFYHHAGLYGVIYFATAHFWTNPATGIREAEPGSEQLVCLNGEIAGAVVLPPDEHDGVGATFWEGFYPAPGLLIAEHLMDGMQNVLGQLVATESLTVEPAIKAALNTAIGSLQRVQRDASQLGHQDYHEARPAEIRAKDRAIQVYYQFINRLMAGITGVNHAACAAINASKEGTPINTLATQVAHDTNALFHLSPFHPEHKP